MGLFEISDFDKLEETGVCVKCDLSGANLSEANLTNAYLSSAKLSIHCNISTECFQSTHTLGWGGIHDTWPREYSVF